MLLEELAKDLVEITSALVSGRTINVMNTDGIIVASTEKERIGSYHQGAREAVQTGRVVSIRQDQLSAYAGAKQGINMPIRVDGTIIGVVGMYGDPEEIRDMAHLLEVYAAKYYQLEAMLRPMLSESSLRSQLLSMLLSVEKTDLSTVRGLLERLHIHPIFPAQVILISAKEGLRLPEQVDALTRRLEEKRLLNPETDIWGIVDDTMVILSSAGTGKTTEAFRPLTEWGYRVSLGTPCDTLWDFRDSCMQAALLDQAGDDAWNDMSQDRDRCRYLLASSAVKEANYLNGLYDRFCAMISEGERETVLESVRCYYECGRSVTQASQRLFIHKNTLQYRVRRALDALGINDLPPFYQEYLIRMLLMRQERNLRLTKP